jgi:hypothetical protein
MVDVELPAGWYTSGLPGAECQHQTYCLRSIDRLPAITSDLAGDFSWLPPVPRPLRWSISMTGEPPGDGRFLARTRAEAIDLPRSFVAPLASPRLLWGLRSMTGCWWSLDGDSLQPLPTSDLLAIRFLTDQQGALFWHLLVDGTPDPPVVVSHQDFSDRETWESSPLEHVYRCAPSFEAFMYRFWIENEIGFRMHDKEALTPEQTRYLEEAWRLFAE